MSTTKGQKPINAGEDTAANNNCRLTRLRNISGMAMSFSFLPPHGIRLDDGDDWYWRGDLEAALQKNPRKLLAYHKALLGTATRGPRLELVSSPKPFMVDETTGRISIAGVNNGTIRAEPPCFGDFTSL